MTLHETGERKPVSPTYQLTIEISGSLVAGLEDAIAYLEERLIGEVPEVLVDLVRDLWRTYDAGLADDGVPAMLFGDDGHQLTGSPEDVEFDDGGENEADALAHFEWSESAEGKAELERFEKFFAFQRECDAETAELYRAWLDDHAEMFARARQEWWREREATLQEAFTLREQALWAEGERTVTTVVAAGAVQKVSTPLRGPVFSAADAEDAPVLRVGTAGILWFEVSAPPYWAVTLMATLAGDKATALWGVIDWDNHERLTACFLAPVAATAEELCSWTVACLKQLNLPVVAS